MSINHNDRDLTPVIAARFGGRADQRRGFTLVELLIVVTVLGLMASVLVPSMNSTSGHISLEAMARTLAADLRTARQMAVNYNTSYVVTFDMSANSYQLAHTGTGSAPAIVNSLGSSGSSNKMDFDQFGAGRLGQSRVVLGGIVLKTSLTSAVDVTFGPVGGTGPTRTQDTVVWLSEGSGQDRKCILITVNWLTGQATVGDVRSFPSTQTRPKF